MDYYLLYVTLTILTIASLQDLKRREIDDWLNLTLIITTFSYVIITTPEQTITLFLMTITLAILAYAFYYGRIFAGGDAKLLFALTAILTTTTLQTSLTNLGLYIFSLMIAGALYGTTYLTYTYLKKRKQVNKKFLTIINKKILLTTIILGIGITIPTIIFISGVIGVFAGLLFSLPILLTLAKAIEEEAFTKKIPGNKLQEGDWLVHDIKIGKHFIKKDLVHGLTNKELQLLKKKKSVLIKEGIPFAPAFLIAFLTYNYILPILI
jgi:Flp pilus assembly protein protease CpaA